MQQKLNPAPTDPTQQMIFAWMPWVFMFMLGSFASGLVVYWTANNILTFTQQYLIMRSQGVDVDFLGNVKQSLKRTRESARRAVKGEPAGGEPAEGPASSGTKSAAEGEGATAEARSETGEAPAERDEERVEVERRADEDDEEQAAASGAAAQRQPARPSRPRKTGGGQRKGQAGGRGKRRR
jgi:uncharacterized membrane protein